MTLTWGRYSDLDLVETTLTLTWGLYLGGWGGGAAPYRGVIQLLIGGAKNLTTVLADHFRRNEIQ